MQLTEVLHGKTKGSHPILVECSMFLEMSKGLPLLRNLPCHYEDFRKVKLRMRKKKAGDQFAQTFNEAFDEIPNGLRPQSGRNRVEQRAGRLRGRQSQRRHV